MAWHGMAWHRSWLLCHCGYSFSFGRFWWLSLELLTVDCDVRRARSSKTVGARIVCHLKKPNMYSLFNFRFPGVICGPGLMLDYNDRCRIIRGAERGIHPRRIRKNFCCTRGSDPCWYKYVQQRQFGHWLLTKSRERDISCPQFSLFGQFCAKSYLVYTKLKQRSSMMNGWEVRSAGSKSPSLIDSSAKR